MAEVHSTEESGTWTKYLPTQTKKSSPMEID
jgi:hypothetical protein